jgi:predicted CXXCH cytochrome family protein
MKKLLVLLPLAALSLAAAGKDSCVQCHANLDGNLQAPAVTFPAKDIHAQAGLGCADCHGGDRSTDDYTASMSKAKGFVGKIARTAIPKTCARCHSDATLMHKYKPQQRVDQLAQYQTSVHGKRLAAGDDAVATCIDCHSVHDIRSVKDALSPVHPLRLAETCARCHADKAHMAKYKIETNQFTDYRTSVHWDAVSKRGDLSAPTCATCHGNHGAAPPQVSSVANVCGSCHVPFEELYNKSPHQPVFSGMGTGGCTVCHSNHGIKKPSVAMLSGEQAVCVQCHDATSQGGVAASDMAGMLGKLSAALDRSDEILKRAHESGMEVAEAQLKQMEGRENLVKARVAVHAFNAGAVRKPVDAGLAIAAETYRSGEIAMQERESRRLGLAFSLIAILVTMLGLWLGIRNLEGKAAKTVASLLLLMLLPAGAAWSAPFEPLNSAEVCGKCHRAIHEAWKSSSHAQAMESRLFQDALEMAEADFGATGRKTCLTCHSPLVAQTNDSALQKKLSWEGVTCEYCHSMRQVNMTGPNPAAVLSLAVVKSGPMQETKGSPHGTVYSEVHTSSLVCAPCHEYKNAGGFPVLTTYSEWKNSQYAKEGKQCQSCHMLRVAGHVVDPKVARSSSAIINLHQMPGSHSLDQLTSAVKAQLSTAREGDRLKVTVDIVNAKAGHYLPTGSPLRQLVLEVRTDVYGGEQLHQQRVYARNVADTHGTALQREHFAFVKGAKVLSDTRLAPGEKRTETFDFAVPASSQAQVKATFWYYYSPMARTESQKRITFLTMNRLVQPAVAVGGYKK